MWLLLIGKLLEYLPKPSLGIENKDDDLESTESKDQNHGINTA